MKIRVREVLVRKDDVGEGLFDVGPGWRLWSVESLNELNWRVLLVADDPVESDWVEWQDEVDRMAVGV